jgi:hypothetical protein
LLIELCATTGVPLPITFHIMLELYGFEQDSAAQRNLQGGVQVRGGRHPCSSKQQVSTDVQGASRAGGAELEAFNRCRSGMKPGKGQKGGEEQGNRERNPHERERDWGHT